MSDPEGGLETLLRGSGTSATRGGAQQIPRPPDWQPGGPPWWADTPVDHVPLQAVRDAFAATGPERPAAPDRPLEPHDRIPTADARPSAVLCALWDEAGEAVVLLTRRSGRLRTHTGEVSFPGGRLDRGETAAAAALREAREEVGLDPAAVDLVGRLPAMGTMSSPAAITPFVGVLPGRPELAPNPAEVERAFAVPVAELMAPGTFHAERWTWPGAGPRSLYFFDLPGDTVWGATARMLVDLLAVLRPVLTGAARPGRV